MLLELFLTLGALCSVLTVFLNATLVTSIFDAWIPIALWFGYFSLRAIRYYHIFVVNYLCYYEHLPAIMPRKAFDKQTAFNCF